MLGFSVYLYEKPDENYVEKMYSLGFKEVFSSLHIPEYSVENIWNHLKQLGGLCLERKMKLTVDISQNMVEKLPVDLSELTKMGVTGLRLDDGFTVADIAALTKEFKVALNASTISLQDLAQLQALGVDFQQLEAWHNYYPRIYTALDEDYFLEQNRLFKSYQLKVAAFVMGDATLRGPTYEGLPTLEKHRNNQIFANTLELLTKFHVNTVLVGDLAISLEAQRQFEQYAVNGAILLRVTMKQNFPALFDRPYHNRPEVARDVVRIVESRGLFAEHQLIDLTTARNVGDVTINMQALVRYAGEVQLVKRPLPEDLYVITIGRIIAKDVVLLNYCGSSQKIQLEDFANGFRKINDRETQ